MAVMRLLCLLCARLFVLYDLQTLKRRWTTHSLDMLFLSELRESCMDFVIMVLSSVWKSVLETSSSLLLLVLPPHTHPENNSTARATRMSKQHAFRQPPGRVPENERVHISLDGYIHNGRFPILLVLHGVLSPAFAYSVGFLSLPRATSATIGVWRSLWF